MGAGPRFSILMPAYNRAAYIAETIECLLGQAFGEFELLIVDDGSTDGTAEIIAGYAARDRRLRVHTQPNAGRPSVGRNVGLERACGDHITFIDSDDLHTPDRLRILDDVLRRHGEGHVVFHDLGFIDACGAALPGTYLGNAGFTTAAACHLRPIGPQCHALGPDFWRFAALRYAALHTCAVSIPRALVQAHGLRFDTRYTIVDDTDMWLRLSLLCPLLYVDRVIGQYRLHQGGISKNPGRLLEESIALHENHLARLEPAIEEAVRREYRRKIAQYWGELGYARRANGDFGAAADAYAKALRIAPSVQHGRDLVKALCRLPVRA